MAETIKAGKYKEVRKRREALKKEAAEEESEGSTIAQSENRDLERWDRKKKTKKERKTR